MKNTAPSSTFPSVPSAEPDNGSTSTDAKIGTLPAVEKEAINTGGSVSPVNPRKNSGLVVAVVVLSILLLAAAGFGVWFFVFRGEDGRDSQTEDEGDDMTDLVDSCIYDSEFVEDITIPSETEVLAGETFTKTWKVLNAGTCNWSGVKLVFSSGDTIGQDVEINVSDTAVNATTEVSVPLTAPSTPGSYRSTWKLSLPGSGKFGEGLVLEIIVVQPVVEDNPPAEVPDPADLIITSLSIDTAQAREGIPINIIVTLLNSGETTASNVHWSWRACAYDTCPYIDSPSTLALAPDEEVTDQMEYTYHSWATYTTDAVVDLADVVAESNEDNNLRQLVIPVWSGLPDLVVESIRYHPDPPVEGQHLGVIVTISNQGVESTGVESIAEWWPSIYAPSPAVQWTVPVMEPGGMLVLLWGNFVYPSWYGTITTRANLDVTNTIVEADETNNSMDKVTPVSKP
jgi:hypothetical protein